MIKLADIRVDGGTQSRSEIHQHVVDEYSSAISDGAVFPPVVAFLDGECYWLADGFHRVAAYRQLGIQEVDVAIRQGTRRDAILYSVGANETHGLRRTNEDKRRAVLTLLNDEEWSTWSNREIARRAAVSDPFVLAIRSSLLTVSSDSRTYTTKHGTTATMDTGSIGSSRGEIGNYRTVTTGENEWYTPAEYVAMVVDVMGGIDVDPASCEAANAVVGAAIFYDQDSDGLRHPWLGRVWLNPPYSRELMPSFARKLRSEIDAGNTTEAIMVSHNNTDTQWFHGLAPVCAALCFPSKRIRFYRGADVAAPVNGQMFMYFGQRPQVFADVFSSIGNVWAPL